MEFDSKEKLGEKLDDIRDAAVKKRMRQEKGEEAEMEVLAWLKPGEIRLGRTEEGIVTAEYIGKISKKTEAKKEELELNNDSVSCYNSKMIIEIKSELAGKKPPDFSKLDMVGKLAKIESNSKGISLGSLGP